jgi:homoserine O-acetyltransferase
VIGGSLGGMQALQWAVDYPDRVGAAISIAANPISAMGLALNHLQRQAIELGKLGNSAASEQAGLALARAIAMCSYKSAELFDQRSGRAANNGSCVQENPFRSLRERFDIAGYLDYQGSKFTRRFDANSYIVLSKAMDTFDPVREYGSDAAAFGRISCPITTVGISSDWLFPSSGVRSWAQRLHSAGATCEYVELNSDHGHDAFLAEAPRMAALLRPYAEKWRQTNPRHNQEQAR